MSLTGRPTDELKIIFFGLFPSSNVSKKHDVSENGSLSVLRKIMGASTLLGPLERASYNHSF
jgi:hypothetical protein